MIKGLVLFSIYMAIFGLICAVLWKITIHLLNPVYNTIDCYYAIIRDHSELFQRSKCMIFELRSFRFTLEKVPWLDKKNFQPNFYYQHKRAFKKWWGLCLVLDEDLEDPESAIIPVQLVSVYAPLSFGALGNTHCLYEYNGRIGYGILIFCNW